MVVVVCILAFIFLLLGYLLWVPFYIEVNSDTGILRARFPLLAEARLFIDHYTLLLSWDILGWGSKTDLLATKQTASASVTVKKPARTGKNGMSFSKAMLLLKTFSITKCEIAVDTGSMPLNGMLYPQFYLAGLIMRKNISINFHNENRVIIEVTNSFSRLLWAFIKSTTVK